MSFQTRMRIGALRGFRYKIRTFGVFGGVRFYLRDIARTFERCGDCGKGLYRLTDENSAGANGAIDINVGGHKKTIHLCWLCYHKNK